MQGEGIPNIGMWSQQQGEDLFACPQLYGLQNSGHGQLHRAAGIPHETGQQARLRPRQELVAAGQQERARQKVLRGTCRCIVRVQRAEAGFEGSDFNLEDP